MLELSADSQWQLISVQDYRNKTANISKALTNLQIQLDNYPNNKFQKQIEILKRKATGEGLSHQEMAELIYYAMKTIRTKASKGEFITTREEMATPTATIKTLTVG